MSVIVYQHRQLNSIFTIKYQKQVNISVVNGWWILHFQSEYYKLRSEKLRINMLSEQLNRDHTQQTHLKWSILTAEIIPDSLCHNTARFAAVNYISVKSQKSKYLL